MISVCPLFSSLVAVAAAAYGELCYLLCVEEEEERNTLPSVIHRNYSAVEPEHTTNSSKTKRIPAWELVRQSVSPWSESGRYSRGGGVSLTFT